MIRKNFFDHSDDFYVFIQTYRDSKILYRIFLLFYVYVLTLAAEVSGFRINVTNTNSLRINGNF